MSKTFVYIRREATIANIISIGEILWDVLPGGEHLGGAPFNFAAHCRRLQQSVLFVSAVGDDERGDRALARMQSLGLRTDFVNRVSTAPTGTVSVSVTAEGQPDYTIFRPAAYDFVALDENRLKALASFEPEWIYFGTLQQTSANTRAATRALLAVCPHARRFYDLNLRKDSYTPELVMNLLKSADVLKLNEDEVTKLAEMSEIPSSSLEHFCAGHAKRFGLQTICVTLGADGCAVFTDGKLVRRQGYQVRVADAVGAGDAFAAAFVHGVSNGWPTAQVAEFANSVGALVASRTGPIPDWTEQEAETLRAMA